MLPRRQVWLTVLAYGVLVPSHGRQESCLSLIAASLGGGAVSLPAVPLTFASFPKGYLDVPRCPTRKWVSHVRTEKTLRPLYAFALDQLFSICGS